jgi:hypothetical protein
MNFRTHKYRVTLIIDGVSVTYNFQTENNKIKAPMFKLFRILQYWLYK